jgi:hypothetical protein
MNAQADFQRFINAVVAFSDAASIDTLKDPDRTT